MDPFGPTLTISAKHVSVHALARPPVSLNYEAPNMETRSVVPPAVQEVVQLLLQEPIEITITHAGRAGRTRRLERDGVLVSQEKR